MRNGRDMAGRKYSTTYGVTGEAPCAGHFDLCSEPRACICYRPGRKRRTPPKAACRRRGACTKRRAECGPVCRLLLLAARLGARGPAGRTATRPAGRGLLAALAAARGTAATGRAGLGLSGLAGTGARPGALAGLAARRAANRSLPARGRAGMDRRAAAFAFLDSDVHAVAAPELDAAALAAAEGPAVLPFMFMPVAVRPAVDERRGVHGLGRHPHAGRRGAGHGIGAGRAEEADGNAGDRS